MGIQSVISQKGSQAHEKAENEKLEIERFFKKHIKCSKTVNEKNEEMQKIYLRNFSPQMIVPLT